MVCSPTVDRCRKLARYFVIARPNASRQAARDYAKSQFPDSAYTVRTFLAEWTKLRGHDDAARSGPPRTSRSAKSQLPNARLAVYTTSGTEHFVDNVSGRDLQPSENNIPTGKAARN